MGRSPSVHPAVNSRVIPLFGLAQSSELITLCTVQIDTGSSDLFLPDASCDTTCHGHTLYDASKSSTAQFIGDPVNITYGIGWAFAEHYTDTVTLAGYTVSWKLLLRGDRQLTIPVIRLLGRHLARPRLPTDSTSAIPQRMAFWVWDTSPCRLFRLPLSSNHLLPKAKFQNPFFRSTCHSRPMLSSSLEE
jgi:hypothetical protein